MDPPGRRASEFELNARSSENWRLAASRAHGALGTIALTGALPYLGALPVELRADCRRVRSHDRRIQRDRGLQLRGRDVLGAAKNEVESRGSGEVFMKILSGCHPLDDTSLVIVWMTCYNGVRESALAVPARPVEVFSRC